MAKIMPQSANIRWEIEEYICRNWNDFIGISVDAPTFGHKFAVRKVNQQHGTNVDEFDVVQTMRYMVQVGTLVSVGWFGSIETFTVGNRARRILAHHTQGRATAPRRDGG